MGVNSLSGGPLGLSIIVNIYSLICLFLSSFLCHLLWKHDSRMNYVFFVSLFSSLSTAASIIQQIHFTANFHTIKESEFQQRLDESKMSQVIINGGAQGLDEGLFWIQFYTYNVNAIMIFFWSIQLLKGTWNLRVLNGFSRWATSISIASKVFAVFFPALLLGIANVPFILATPVTFLVLCNLMLAISLVGGSIILVLTLFKFIQARRKLNSISGSGQGSRSRTARSTNGIEGSAAMDAADARRRRDDRWIVIRFSIAFVLLSIFELCIIMFQYLGYNSYVTTDTPTLNTSTAAQITAIAQFIPGVTASLVAFLVWGTTATFRAETARFFTCYGAGRRGSRLGNEERGGVKPDYFQKLPERSGRAEGINVTTELTIINAGKKEVKIQEWEESDEDTDGGAQEPKGKADGSWYVGSATSTGVAT